MGIRINRGQHICPVGGWGKLPVDLVPMLEWARQRVGQIAKRTPSCDRYFVQLAERRTLTALLRQQTIWLNYSPQMRGAYGQVDLRHRGDIGLGPLAFAEGRWRVLGTLIHELAHINGAGIYDRSAEQSLVHCGLGVTSEIAGDDDPQTPYHPWRSG